MDFIFDDYDELESKKKPLDKGNQFDNQLIRMGSALSRQLHFSDSEEKLFALAISQVDFFAQNEQISVEMRVKDVQEKLGLAEDGAFYTNLRKQYRNLAKKSYVEFDLENEDNDFCDGFLLTGIHSNKRKGSLTIDFNSRFKKSLQYCKLAYTRVPLDDTLAYKSRFAIILQRYLTSLYRTGKGNAQIQWFDFTTEQLKTIFGLSEKDYCYKSGKNKGKFKRTEFEKYTLQIACDEINSKSACMRIVDWEKERARGVIYYRIAVMIATKIKKEPPVIDADIEEEQLSLF